MSLTVGNGDFQFREVKSWKNARELVEIIGNHGREISGGIAVYNIGSIEAEDRLEKYVIRLLGNRAREFEFSLVSEGYDGCPVKDNILNFYVTPMEIKKDDAPEVNSGETK